MNKKMYVTQQKKEENNVVFHMDKVEATLQNKPYIIPASKAGTYSKKEKAENKALRQLKRELNDYTKYNR